MSISPEIAAAPKITRAIGMPDASVFFDPQNTAAISSSLPNFNARAAVREMVSARKRTTAAPTPVCTRTTSPKFVHKPRATESENAENTISKITILSNMLTYFLNGSKYFARTPRSACPTKNGRKSSVKRSKIVCESGSGSPVVCAKIPMSSGVRKIPSRLEIDALKIAAGMLPRAAAVIATDDEIVDGSAPRK